MADFNSLLFGVPGGYEQRPKFTPQGMTGLSAALQQGTSALQNPMAGFEPLAQRARQQFTSQTIPGIAERFTAMGGGQRSSAFQGALGNAASDFESQLASLASQYGLQNRRQGLEELKFGAQYPFENLPIKGQRGVVEQLAPMVLENLPAIISAAGNYATGGASGAAEAGIKALMSLFNYFKGNRPDMQAIKSGIESKEKAFKQNYANLPQFELSGIEQGPTQPRGLPTGSMPDINDIFKWLASLGGSTPTDAMGRPLSNRID